MITKKKKQNLIAKHRVHEKDTGSPDVQIALLSHRIDALAGHLRTNAKDNHSRKGLLAMVADRRSHMKYLKKKDAARYGELAKKLGLKE